MARVRRTRETIFEKEMTKKANDIDVQKNTEQANLEQIKPKTKKMEQQEKKETKQENKETKSKYTAQSLADFLY